jgi:hypothetical protein
LKHQPDAPPLRYAYRFGSSQSDGPADFPLLRFQQRRAEQAGTTGSWRTRRSGPHLDQRTRRNPNAASASNVTNFPFTNGRHAIPDSGRTEGLLDNDRARQNQPKIFFTNSAVEYWNTRAAALTHTTPDGRTDVAPPDNTRIYFLTGTQHSPGQFPPRRTTGQQLDNPVQYWWTLRALLTAMDRWVREGTPPPASQYPKLSDSTLVRRETVAFPAIPGVQSPRILQPAQQGSTPLPFLVPQVDETATSERDQVVSSRLSLSQRICPELPKPSGQRAERTGIADGIVDSIRGNGRRESPERSRRRWPRAPSKEQYLMRREARHTLVKGGYLLAADVPQVIKRMDGWDLARGREN